MGKKLLKVKECRQLFLVATLCFVGFLFIAYVVSKVVKPIAVQNSSLPSVYHLICNPPERLDFPNSKMLTVNLVVSVEKRTYEKYQNIERKIEAVISESLRVSLVNSLYP